MILLDPAVAVKWRDYGILIPFPPDRPRNIVGFLKKSADPCPMPIVSIKEALEFLGKKTEFEISEEALERVHKKEYIDIFFQESKEKRDLETTRAILDIYELVDEKGNYHRYNKELAKKTMRDLFETSIMGSLKGSYLAARLALENESGFCFYLSGGNHHARYDWGAGFCVLNDVIFTARAMQNEGRAKIIWIIDVDAHKGCGSAEIVDFIRRGINPHHFEEDCTIVTLSIHMARGWPLDRESMEKSKPDRAPNIKSDIEIPVEKGEESLYTKKLEAGLMQFAALSGGKNADLAIVVDGDDPYEYDEIESSSLLKLTLTQMLERDTLIYDFLVSRGIKSVWLLAGGYGERAWEPAANFLKSLTFRK